MPIVILCAFALKMASNLTAPILTPSHRPPAASGFHVEVTESYLTPRLILCSALELCGRWGRFPAVLQFPSKPKHSDGKSNCDQGRQDYLGPGELKEIEGAKVPLAPDANQVHGARQRAIHLSGFPADTHRQFCNILPLPAKVSHAVLKLKGDIRAHDAAALIHATLLVHGGYKHGVWRTASQQNLSKLLDSTVNLFLLLRRGGSKSGDGGTKHDQSG